MKIICIISLIDKHKLIMGNTKSKSSIEALKARDKIRDEVRDNFRKLSRKEKKQIGSCHIRMSKNMFVGTISGWRMSMETKREWNNDLIECPISLSELGCRLEKLDQKKIGSDIGGFFVGPAYDCNCAGFFDSYNYFDYCDIKKNHS